MAEINDVYGSIYQNLLDAGCDEHMAEKCMDLVKEEKCADMLPILAGYRASLLSQVHDGQKRLDCLDFLVYKIKKKIQEEK